jgi:hypothetical protein
MPIRWHLALHAICDAKLCSSRPARCALSGGVQFLCILDRPVPCGSDAGGPAAVADESLHGWEVRPHDTIDQAAGDKWSRDGSGVRVALAHPQQKGAEVMGCPALKACIDA